MNQRANSNDLELDDVARLVGYRQPAQFAKAFRRHYGCSPSKFREARNGVPLVA